MVLARSRNVRIVKADHAFARLVHCRAAINCGCADTSVFSSLDCNRCRSSCRYSIDQFSILIAQEACPRQHPAGPPSPVNFASLLHSAARDFSTEQSPRFHPAPRPGGRPEGGGGGSAGGQEATGRCGVRCGGGRSAPPKEGTPKRAMKQMRAVEGGAESQPQSRECTYRLGSVRVSQCLFSNVNLPVNLPVNN